MMQNLDISLILVLVNIGISVAAFNNSELFRRFQFNPYTIANKKEWWRFFTHGFIHADYLHLAFNMIALYSFGRYIQAQYTLLFGDKATLYFLCLYFGGMLTAVIPTYERHKKDIWYNSVGASGAVSAVIFAFVIYAPFSFIGVFFIPVPAIVFAVLYVVFSIYADRRGGSNINHSAHLSGAFFGLLFTAIVDRGAYSDLLITIQNLFN